MRKVIQQKEEQTHKNDGQLAKLRKKLQKAEKMNDDLVNKIIAKSEKEEEAV